MKKWETIADITIDSIKQNISITKDTAGNGFELEKMSVLIYSPPSTDILMMISVFPKATRSGNGLEVMSTTKTTDDGNYGIVKFEPVGFGIFATFLAQSINSKNAFTSLLHKLPAGGFGGINDEVINNDYDTVTGVWVGSHYQNVLTPGTRIIIRGIRV